MNEPAIHVAGLRKTYSDGWFNRRRVQALRDVSFTVEPGSIFGLLGPNGAGKTTLIKILLGLVYKSGGDAVLLGRPAGDRDGRRHVGYLPENHRIPRHLNGNTAMQYYGGLSGLSPAVVRARRDELLSRVGLAKWGTMSVKKYSKGMLQRLGLAQAMLHDPQVLILDEPTDGVDPVGRSEMRQVLQQLKAEGKTIFINSHLLQEVELICDRVAILVNGTVRRVGPVEEITTERTRSAVEFVVSGADEAVRGCFEPASIQDWIAEDTQRFRVLVTVAGQADVNRCIDALRRSEADIISMTRPRDSLEDAFMTIVASDTTEAE